MFISKVNRLCERHGRVAILLIALVIIIPFVFLGWGSNRMGGGGEGRRVIGDIYGKPLTLNEYSGQYRAVQLQYFLRSGRMPDDTRQFREYMFEETLRRMRLLHEARRQDLLKVADSQVEDQIRDMFTRDQGFDAEFYKMFASNMLPRLGMTEKDFMEVIRQNIAIDRLQREVISSVFVTPAEVRMQAERQETAFTVKQAVFQMTDYLQEASLEPSEEQVREYYETNQDDIRLPEKKRVRVAVLPLEDQLEKVEISDEQIRNWYDAQSARFTAQEKTLEDAKAEISETLREQQARQQLLELGRDLIQRLTDAFEQAEADAKAADVMGAVAQEMGIKVIDSGPFTEDMPIPNVGKLPQLQEAAYALGPDNLFSGLIYERDSKTYYMATWLETIPGEKAEEFTAEVARMLKKRLEEQKIEEYYQENVAPFSFYVEQGLSPDDVTQLHQDGNLKGGFIPQDVADLSPPEFRQHVQQTVRPFYEPVQKSVRFVRFDADDFTDQAGEVTQEDIEKHYHEQAEKYAPQVQVSHILLKVDEGATAEEKAEVRQRLESIRKQIEEGAEFAEMARQHSEDEGSAEGGGSLPYMTRRQLVEPFAEAAFALDDGELSDIVETRFGLHLIKLDSRKPGQTVEEASDEIRRELILQRAGEKAWEAADTFAYNAYDAVTDADAEQKAVSEAFAEFVEKQGLEWQDTPLFTENSRVPALGSNPSVAREAHNVTEEQPVSEVITATNRYYVVSLLKQKQPRLPSSLSDAPRQRSIVRSVLRQKEALKLARNAAEQAYATLNDKLQAEVSLEDVQNDFEFSDVPEFTYQSPPWGTPNARLISDAVKAHDSGSLLAPIETDRGAILLYLKDRQKPDDDELAAALETARQGLLREKQGAVLNEFYQRLADESDTQIAPEVRDQLI